MTITSLGGTRETAVTLRLPLWLWPALGTMALLLAAGAKLLNDPDTHWQIAVGDWIIAHRSFPRADIFSFTMKDQPWISTSSAAQVLFAGVYRLFGWSGPVVLTALAAASAIALLARFLSARMAAIPALLFAIAALVLAMPHMTARPHVLAMPVMVLWAGSVIAAADRKDAPSLWLLPLMTVWTNLHGSFVLGLALTGAMAIDAVWNAQASERKALSLRWAVFGVLAVIACCVTPYGWNSLIAAYRILTLGEALPMILEWRPMDFSSLGPFEVVVLGAIGLALWRGVTLPALRLAMLLVLVHMALSSIRHADALAMLAPLLLAAPLSDQIGKAETEKTAGTGSTMLQLVAAASFAAAIGIMLVTMAYAPSARASPAAAVVALKQQGVQRILNEYSFGGYMIASGLAPFIDGRTELYGPKMMRQHDLALSSGDPAELVTLLDGYKIDATLLSPTTPAAKLLDRTDGWQRLFADDVAVVHIRKPPASPQE